MRKFNSTIFFGNKQCVNEIGALFDVINGALSAVGAMQQNGLQGTQPVDDSQLEKDVEDAVNDVAAALGVEIEAKPGIIFPSKGENASLPIVEVSLGDLCHFGPYSICAEAGRQGAVEPIKTLMPSFSYKPLGVSPAGNIMFAVRPCPNGDEVESGWHWYEGDQVDES